MIITISSRIHRAITHLSRTSSFVSAHTHGGYGMGGGGWVSMEIFGNTYTPGSGAAIAAWIFGKAFLTCSMPKKGLASSVRRLINWTVIPDSWTYFSLMMNYDWDYQKHHRRYSGRDLVVGCCCWCCCWIWLMLSLLLLLVLVFLVVVGAISALSPECINIHNCHQQRRLSCPQTPGRAPGQYPSNCLSFIGS